MNKRLKMNNRQKNKDTHITMALILFIISFTHLFLDVTKVSLEPLLRTLRGVINTENVNRK